MRMEFEALEDEANAIHGDLWEQLNAGGQVTNGFSKTFLLSRQKNRLQCCCETKYYLYPQTCLFLMTVCHLTFLE